MLRFMTQETENGGVINLNKVWDHMGYATRISVSL